MFDNLDKTKKEKEDSIVNNQNDIPSPAKADTNVMPEPSNIQSNNSVKKNVDKSKGVEDIFQETDKFSPDNKNLPPNISKDQLERMKSGNKGFSSEKHRPYRGPVSKGAKIIRIVILIILIVTAIGFGSYYLYNNVFMSEESSQEENLNTQAEGGEQEKGEEVNVMEDDEEEVKDPLVKEKEKEISEEETLKAKDTDADGLNDWEEINIYGTNPLNSDSDNDGLNDGDEVHIYDTDPLNPDTDGDGLKDGEEVLIYKTNPLNPDTDGDGYLDGEEVESGHNPLGEGKLEI